MKIFRSLKTITINKYFFLLLCLTVITELNAQTISLSSPNKKISYAFRRAKLSPVYSILYKNDKLVIDAPLWLNFTEGGKFANDLSFGQRTFLENNSQREYNEVTIPIKERSGLHRHVNLVVRAYNNGIAFRYDSSGEIKWMAFTAKNNHPGFDLVEDPKLLDLLNKENNSIELSAKPVLISSSQSTTVSLTSNQSSWHFMSIDENSSISDLRLVQNIQIKSK
jgi:hypothetical protein